MDTYMIMLPPTTTFGSPGEKYRAHQLMTARQLIDHDVVINDSMTGSGKTKASLLFLKHLDRTLGRGYHAVVYVAPVNSLASQTLVDAREFLKEEGLDSRYVAFPVIASTLKELQAELKKSRREEKHSKADLLSMLFSDPVSMAREASTVIANQPGIDSQAVLTKRVNYLIIINPDILYYALFTERYNRRQQDIHVNMLNNIKYMIFDEFHYYTMFQLNAFIAIASFWKVSGKFASGSRMCMLSATPNWLCGMLEKMGVSFDIVDDERIEPSMRGEPEPFLAPVRLHLHEKTSEDTVTGKSSAFNHEMSERQDIDGIMKRYIDDGKYGAVIGNSIRHVNNIYFHYLNKFGRNVPMSRITGAVEKEERAVAVNARCLFCTSTVDIGFNFKRADAGTITNRQFIDFLFVDFATRDEFTQRVGRAGRVSKNVVHDIPSDVHVFFPSSVLDKIKERLQDENIENMSRKDIMCIIESFIPEKAYGDQFFKDFGYFTCRLFVDAIRKYNIASRNYSTEPDKEAFYKRWEDMLLSIYGSPVAASNRLDMLYNLSREKDDLWQVDDKKKVNLLYHYYTDDVYRPVGTESGTESMWRRINGGETRRSKKEIVSLMREAFIDNKDNPKNVTELNSKKLEISSYYKYNKRFFSTIIENFRDGDDIDINVIVKDTGHLLSNSDETEYGMVHIMNTYDYTIVSEGEVGYENKPVVAITKRLDTNYRPVSLYLDLSGNGAVTKGSFEGDTCEIDDVMEREKIYTCRYMWKFGWFEKGDLSVRCEGAKIPMKMLENLERGIVGFIVPEHYLYTGRTRGFLLIVKFRDGTSGEYALFTGKNAMETRCKIREDTKEDGS